LRTTRSAGAGIEIDDFGTGPAAPSYLKYIPAIQVKIDQLFVNGLAGDRDSQIMARSTINLVHELGGLVVADGIREHIGS
jgi:EAL domain-containing protein (putative c-di-GMP-specific phosphodiesterase class I)